MQEGILQRNYLFIKCVAGVRRSAENKGKETRRQREKKVTMGPIRIAVQPSVAECAEDDCVTRRHRWWLLSFDALRTQRLDATSRRNVSTLATKIDASTKFESHWSAEQSLATFAEWISENREQKGSKSQWRITLKSNEATIKS